MSSDIHESVARRPTQGSPTHILRGQTIEARLSLQEVDQPQEGEAANENEELSSTLIAA
jgi:hypothetical protein